MQRRRRESLMSDANELAKMKKPPGVERAGWWRLVARLARSEQYPTRVMTGTSPGSEACRAGPWRALGSKLIL